MILIEHGVNDTVFLKVVQAIMIDTGNIPVTKMTLVGCDMRP